MPPTDRRVTALRDAAVGPNLSGRCSGATVILHGEVCGSGVASAKLMNRADVGGARAHPLISTEGGEQVEVRLRRVDERELKFSAEAPLVGWRLFRVRSGDHGFVLTAPLIHDPDFEWFPSPSITARCYERPHPAPAPRCRCGLYVAVDGTLDSLAGYLADSAHDQAPPVYAEVRAHWPGVSRSTRRSR